MTIRSTLAAVAAAGLMIAPMAAQASSRAADSVPQTSKAVASAPAGARQSAAVAKKNSLSDTGTGILVAALAGGIGLAIALGGDDNGSNGAN